jgi:hypothetical protein
MKIGPALVMLCLFLPGYVHADDDTPNEAKSNLVKEMTEMAVCTANEIVLMQHRLQVDATITAQTDNNPQLRALAESFAKMAQTNHAQIETYASVMKDQIIPDVVAQFTGVKEDEAIEAADKMINSALNSITTLYAEQPLDKQIAIERKILTKATLCESLASTIRKSHTL